MSHPYNNTYYPAIPVIEVLFGSPEEPPAIGPFEAIIDTGADVTVVPKDILLGSGAPSLVDAQLRSPWGEPHEVMIYLVDVQLGTILQTATPPRWPQETDKYSGRTCSPKSAHATTIVLKGYQCNRVTKRVDYESTKGSESSVHPLHIRWPTPIGFKSAKADFVYSVAVTSSRQAGRLSH